MPILTFVRAVRIGILTYSLSLIAVVSLRQLATITNLVELCQSPILYLFAGCQVRQGVASLVGSPKTEDW